MNSEAERHLVKAEQFLARGEEFYRKAAGEIVAAQKADPTLILSVIGERFGRTSTWVRDLVQWVTSESETATPYSGKAISAKKDEEKVRRALRDAPAEEIAAMIPPERREEIVSELGGPTVEQVQAQLQKPEVVEQVMDDPVVRSRVERDADRRLIEQREKSRSAKDRQAGERRERVGLRYVEVDGLLARSKRELISALRIVREVEWDDEARELLIDSLAKNKALIDLVEMSLTGSADIDWDAELAKITGG